MNGSAGVHVDDREKVVPIGAVQAGIGLGQAADALKLPHPNLLRALLPQFPELLQTLLGVALASLLLGSAVVGTVRPPLSGLVCLRWLQRRQRAS